MRSRVTSAVIVFILLLLVWAGALAHGIGTPQVLNAETGPYLISVWTDPDPLRADEAHVVVAVAEPETREAIVTGVVVTVEMQSLTDPSAIITRTAETDETNQLLFAAEFNDQVSEGRWRVGVSAAGERGVGEEVSFEVEVSHARGFNWLWIGIGGLIVFVMAWFAVSTRSTPSPGRAKRHAHLSL